MKLIIKILLALTLLSGLGYLLYPVIYLGGTYTGTASVENNKFGTDRNEFIKITISRESPLSGEYSLNLSVGGVKLSNVQMIDLGDKFFLLGQDESGEASTEAIKMVLAVGILTKLSFQEYSIDLNFSTISEDPDSLTSYKLKHTLKRVIDKTDPLIHLYGIQ